MIKCCIIGFQKDRIINKTNKEINLFKRYFVLKNPFYTSTDIIELRGEEINEFDNSLIYRVFNVLM